MLARRYTQLLGLYFLVSGAWGLFSRSVLWIFTADVLHAVIELALASLAFFWAIRRPQVALYLVIVGAILMIVGAMRFIAGLDTIIVGLLNVNPALAMANLILGAIAIAMGAASRRAAMTTAP